MTLPTSRYILHADLDAFYASVEQRDNPALKGRPVVVGGPPETRGVVAAASYEARRYGIHSAMAMRTALRACPELVRVSPRFSSYREVSRQVMETFRRLTPLVEPLSLDEAYLDISEQVPLERVQEEARALKDSVRWETELAVTIGGGSSKTVAKIASQVAKPDGLLLINPGEERAFLAPLDVEMLGGVGPKTAAVLREYSINTLGQLATCDEAWLGHTFGKRGPELRERARGIDLQRVAPERETKSVSAESTMPQDVEDESALREEMQGLVQSVSRRLQRTGLKGKTVYIKLRLADFTTFTRQMTLLSPTDEAEVIFQVAFDLLRRELKPGRRFRLVGVGVTNFQGGFQLAMSQLI
ncbi:MAG: DNA polymerase IV [Dehalococcoidia bacterium]